MAQKTVLNKSGLTYFWGKLKTYVANAVSGKLDKSSRESTIIQISPSAWDTSIQKYRIEDSRITLDRDIDIAPVTAEYYVDQRGWTSTEFVTMIDQISNARFYVRRHNDGYIDLGYLGTKPTVNVYLEIVLRWS